VTSELVFYLEDRISSKFKFAGNATEFVRQYRDNSTGRLTESYSS
jgi:hypothetical protein